MIKFTAILCTTGLGLYPGTHIKLIKKATTKYKRTQTLLQQKSERQNEWQTETANENAAVEWTEWGRVQGSLSGIPERSSDWLAIRLAADWLGTMPTLLAFIRRSGDGRGGLKVWWTGQCTRDCGLGWRFNRTNGYEWFNGHCKGGWFYGWQGFFRAPIHNDNERLNS